MNVLEIKNLNKKYEKFTLDNVSFNVEEGKIMGFIGRNGAGKSTTLKSLLNFVHADSGEIKFFGKNFCENEFEIKQKIGFAEGGIDYYSKKKLRTITKVTKRFYTFWDDERYKHYIELFSLDEDKTPSQLSSGMKVKYALTLALSHNAELLIFDEPTSGLDPVSRDELLDIFISLAKEGVSILFSTHITSDLEKCADDITYIKNGKIFASKPLDEFTNEYKLLTIENEQLSPELEKALIGCKPSKNGYTALALNGANIQSEIKSSPASLEDIMIHLEKEDRL